MLGETAAKPNRRSCGSTIRRKTSMLRWEPNLLILTIRYRNPRRAQKNVCSVEEAVPPNDTPSITRDDRKAALRSIIARENPKNGFPVHNGSQSAPRGQKDEAVQAPLHHYEGSHHGYDLVLAQFGSSRPQKSLPDKMPEPLIDFEPRKIDM